MRISVVLNGLLCLLSLQAAAADAVGNIKTFRPEAVVTHEGVERQMEIGAKIYSGDSILTGSEGSVGIVFIDGSVLSLGANTEFVIEEFLFEPDVANVSLLSRILRGTVSFISGAIGRISPQSVKFETPNATLGFRGTKVLIKVD